ncbi:MAG: energy transducer TonB [Bacteroidota bacterium]|nr:energy transducer TonB [Bacteroidota bacterium]
MIHRTNSEMGLDTLVFENRNQAYGAFELRMVYNDHIKNSLIIVFFGMLTLFGILYGFQSLYPVHKAESICTDCVFQPIDISESIVIPVSKTETRLIQPKSNTSKPVQTINSNYQVVSDNKAVTQVEPSETTNNNASVESPTGSESSIETQPTSTIEIIESKPVIIETVKYADKMPVFEGGEHERIKFMGKNLNFPKEASALGISGKTIVQFVVLVDGSISNVKVAKSSGYPTLDSEAVRVTRKMPKWTPGKLNGKDVNVMITSPINFVLE